MLIYKKYIHLTPLIRIPFQTKNYHDHHHFTSPSPPLSIQRYHSEHHPYIPSNPCMLASYHTHGTQCSALHLPNKLAALGPQHRDPSLSTLFWWLWGTNPLISWISNLAIKSIHVHLIVTDLSLPEPSTHTLPIRAWRHPSGNFKHGSELLDAVVIDAKDNEILGANFMRIGFVCNCEGASPEVVVCHVWS